MPVIKAATVVAGSQYGWSAGDLPSTAPNELDMAVARLYVGLCEDLVSALKRGIIGLLEKSDPTMDPAGRNQAANTMVGALLQQCPPS